MCTQPSNVGCAIRVANTARGHCGTRINRVRAEHLTWAVHAQATKSALTPVPVVPGKDVLSTAPKELKRSLALSGACSL